MKPNNFPTPRTATAAALLMLGLLAFATALPAAADCPPGQVEFKAFEGRGVEGRALQRACIRPSNDGYQIETNWSDGGPRVCVKDCPGKADRPGLEPQYRTYRDDFSASYAGEVRFEDGVYEFVAQADDGIRVAVDGESIIDEWDLHQRSTFRARVELRRGYHHVLVHYFERRGYAWMRVGWRKVGPLPD